MIAYLEEDSSRDMIDKSHTILLAANSEELGKWFHNLKCDKKWFRGDKADSLIKHIFQTVESEHLIDSFETLKGEDNIVQILEKTQRHTFENAMETSRMHIELPRPIDLEPIVILFKWRDWSDDDAIKLLTRAASRNLHVILALTMDDLNKISQNTLDAIRQRTGTIGFTPGTAVYPNSMGDLVSTIQGYVITDAAVSIMKV